LVIRKFFKGGKLMVRRIKAIFTDSLSGDMDVSVAEVTLIAPDIVVEEDYGGDLAFRIIEKICDDQDTVEIDLPHSKLYVIEKPSENIDMNWLATASLLDVIRLGAK
jgi:hypothetical protein